MLTTNADNGEMANLYKSELLAKILHNRKGVIAQATDSSNFTINDIPLRSNILGIGYGLRDVDDKIQNDIALRVYVSKKLPFKGIPLNERIPSKVNGLPTDVIATNRIIAHARPTKCGCSIGHYKIGAGTLGCIVRGKDSAINEFYILSNNHVLANCNESRIGDPILEPGSINGGNDADPIAYLEAYERIKFRSYEVFGVPIFGKRVNTMDAAIARLIRTEDVVPEIHEIGKLGIPEAIASQRQQVCKYGIGSRYSEGTVVDRFADIKIYFQSRNREADFVEQLCIKGIKQEFSRTGDSGSLVVDKDTRQAVGLLVGGEDTLSFATPISRVLERFNIAICHE